MTGQPLRNEHNLLRLATAAGSSSFLDFLSSAASDLLPAPGPAGSVPEHRHATTIVAVTFAGGVLLAGDRRATMGNLIAQRDVVKVHPADDYSLVGMAGTAGFANDLTRLFQVELEHYEKIEGTALTLDGKANRLSTMIRGNLGAAMQGLAVVPLFVGYDLDQAAAGDPSRAGRIFSYDVTGGRYPEQYYHAVGSGSLFAKGALKKLWRAELTEEQAVEVAVEALYDAADDDSATGGPDLDRRIYPVIYAATADGVRRVADEVLEELVRALLRRRAAAYRAADGLTEPS